MGRAHHRRPEARGGADVDPHPGGGGAHRAEGAPAEGDGAERAGAGLEQPAAAAGRGAELAAGGAGLFPGPREGAARPPARIPAQVRGPRRQGQVRLDAGLYQERRGLAAHRRARERTLRVQTQGNPTAE